MRITTRVERHLPSDTHRRVTVFVNGANAGMLTLRESEVEPFVGQLEAVTDLLAALKKIFACRCCASAGETDDVKHTCDLGAAEALVLRLGGTDS